jgi:deoxyxylulose-5-phosphate synthase
MVWLNADHSFFKVPILENIRDNVPETKPVLLHVKSVKGKGYHTIELAAVY